jgi:hypothetical protein
VVEEEPGLVVEAVATEVVGALVVVVVAVDPVPPEVTMSVTTVATTSAPTVPQIVTFRRRLFRSASIRAAMMAWRRARCRSRFGVGMTGDSMADPCAVYRGQVPVRM